MSAPSTETAPPAPGTAAGTRQHLAAAQRWRLAATSLRTQRVLAWLALITQSLIAVTGSVVRVTGSGLGCPTWPNCFPGSFTPAPHDDVATLNQWVEYGNRLLTSAVGGVAVLCVLAALLALPRRRRVLGLAVGVLAGTALQAVWGGMTVYLELAWWSVVVHLLASMALVWIAVLLVHSHHEGDAAAEPLVPRPVRGLLRLAALLLAALLLAGTLVTAAGPHAGDPDTPRLPLGVPLTVQLHADLLFAFLGVLLALGFTLAAVSAPRKLRRRYLLLLAAVLAQGALGGLQYALGVPEALVSLHVLGATMVTAAMAAVWAASRRRSSAATTPPAAATQPLAM